MPSLLSFSGFVEGVCHLPAHATGSSGLGPQNNRFRGKIKNLFVDEPECLKLGPERKFFVPAKRGDF